MSTSNTRGRWPNRETIQQATVGALAALPLQLLLENPAAERPLRRIVVVTGPHRSGTTILGRLLAHAPRTHLVHEPFNLDWGLAGVPHRYPLMTASDTDHPAATVVRRYLTSGEGQWMGHGKPLGPQHARARSNRAGIRVRRPFGSRVLVKDPFMLLALGWINHALSDVPPVVTLRHPCAWVASLQRRSMHPHTALAAFRAQDGYDDPVVTEILERRDWERASLVEAGAATWAILVRMLGVQLDDGARATVLRMEDFAADPHDTMVRMFRETGLPAPRRLDQIVENYTGGHNIVTPDKPVLHELRRNSAALAHAWRTQLPEADQKTIRRITEQVASRWYDTW